MKFTILRSAVIGTAVGILPGAGATIASFLSYAAEIKLSKHPETFGKGEPRGVAASETANNAATGGSMVPLLSMGIPGGNAAAVMMAAMTIKGVQMGPLLIRTQPQFLSTVFATQVLTGVLMVIISIGVAKVFTKILDIPYSYLGTTILMLSIVGAFATNNNITNVLIIVIAALVGVAFNKFKFSSSALVLGLVLGEICESNLRRGVLISKGFAGFFRSPITTVLLIVSAFMLLWPMAGPTVKKVLKKEPKAAQ